MGENRVLILDCQGESRPAISFNLEVAKFAVRIVGDTDEAINLLKHSQITEEEYCGFLVNNPYLNVDINGIVEDVKNLGVEIPVVFVKDSANLKKMVQSLAIEYRRPRIYHAEPVKVVEMLKAFLTQQIAAKKADNNLSTAI